MASAQAALKAAPCAVKAFTTQRPAFGRLTGMGQKQSSCLDMRRPLEGTAIAVRGSTTQTQAVHQVFELADRGSFIGGTAATIFAMTLIGLAIGFVLLRVEALSEEGKI